MKTTMNSVIRNVPRASWLPLGLESGRCRYATVPPATARKVHMGTKDSASISKVVQHPNAKPKREPTAKAPVMRPCILRIARPRRSIPTEVIETLKIMPAPSPCTMRPARNAVEASENITTDPPMRNRPTPAARGPLIPYTSMSFPASGMTATSAMM